METNKSKNLILILLFILLIINISIVLTFFLYPKRNIETKQINSHFVEERMREGDKMYKYLNLEMNQKNKFSKLKNIHRKNIKIMFDSLKIERNNMLNDMLSNDILSNDKFYEYADKISDIDKKIQYETVSYFLEMKKMLDKEQFEKFIENFRNMHSFGMKHHNNNINCNEKTHKKVNNTKNNKHFKKQNSKNCMNYDERKRKCRQQQIKDVE